MKHGIFLFSFFTGDCIDDNEMCGEWASHGFCEDDAHTGYMLVFCKKSCEVCDSGIDGSEQTTDAPLSITQSPGNFLKYPSTRGFPTMDNLFKITYLSCYR